MEESELKKIFKVTIVVVLVFFLSFGTTSREAVVANTHPGFDKIADQVELLDKHTTTLNHLQLEESIDKITSLIETKEIVVQGDQENLDFEQIIAYKFDEEYDHLSVIVIPYKDTAGPYTIQNLTVIFSEENNLLEFNEIKVTESKEKFKSFTYINGDEVSKAEVLKVGVQDDIETFGYMDDVVKCLERYGITPETALLLAQTCLTICTFTLGVGCLICAGAVSAGGATALVWCLTSSI